MTPILFILLAIGLLGVGFGFGVFFERLNWNKLIRDGKLPRPSQHRTATQD